MSPNENDRARMEQQAQAERRPGDPTATKPRQARGMLYVVAAALIVAAALLAVMWMNNPRYDGNSPAPVRDAR